MRSGGFALSIGFALALFASAAKTETSISLYPPPDRTWTEFDYVQFYFAHFNGNRALPHLRDADTRAVFDRLVSMDNLAKVSAASHSDSEKLAELGLMLSALGSIRAAYNISVQVGEPLAEELTRIQIFTLVVLDDAQRLSRAVGQAPSEAWSTTIGGVIASLGESAVYTTAQRRELADALSEHMSALSPLLSKKAKEQAMDKVGTQAAGESDAALRSALNRLLIAVSES